MATEKTHPIRNSVLATLIGGAITTLVVYLIPGGWAWIVKEGKGVIVAVATWSGSSLLVPAWLVVILSLIALAAIIAAVVVVLAIVRKPSDLVESFTENAASILLVCLVTLTGCLSSDISRSKEFRPHLAGGLKTQRLCYAYKSEHMKSVMFGGWVEVWRITDERPSMPAMIIPVGTPVRITRIERRNLVDHGTEIVAFGVVRMPDTGAENEFLYELTVGLGERIRRAPWQDQSVPEFRSAENQQPNKRPEPMAVLRTAMAHH